MDGFGIKFSDNSYITSSVWSIATHAFYETGKTSGTVYTNTNSIKPIYVWIFHGTNLLSIAVNGNPIFPSSNSGLNRFSVSFIVPPQQTYTVTSTGTAGTTGIVSWLETV